VTGLYLLEGCVDPGELTPGTKDPLIKAVNSNRALDL